MQKHFCEIIAKHQPHIFIKLHALCGLLVKVDSWIKLWLGGVNVVTTHIEIQTVKWKSRYNPYEENGCFNFRELHLLLPLLVLSEVEATFFLYQYFLQIKVWETAEIFWCSATDLIYL